MVQVSFNDDATSPSEAYALACWRENPRISPSSWRQALGHTVGKMAFDGRFGLEGLAEAIGVGANVVIVGAPQVAEVARLVVTRDEIVIVGVGAPEAYVDGADWWLWPVGEEIEVERLQVLEQAVKDGRLEAYGVSGDAGLDVAAWAKASAATAETVWGRKKRGGLRVIELPLNGAEQEALRGRDGEATDSPLEVAARMGMAVIASRAAQWRGPWGEVEIGVEAPMVGQEALLALTALGEAEQKVPGLPGGVLPALMAGASPWPTRAAWRLFEGTVWPVLEQTLLARTEEGYVQAWRRFMPYGQTMAAMAEARLAGVLAAQVAASLPEAWREASPLAQAWGMVASVPGISVVAADLRGEKARKAMVEAMERPDVVDVKRALDGVIHRP